MSVMIKFDGYSMKTTKEHTTVFICNNRVSAITEMPEPHLCCIHTDGGNFIVHSTQEKACKKLGFPISDQGPFQ